MNEEPIRAIVIDDEALARRDLVAQLEEAPNVEVIAEASGGREGIELVNRLRPEVAFVDIRMPEVDGIEVAVALEETPTAVVFVTGFDHFAVRAFELGTLDYITKPARPERLTKTLERIRERRGDTESPKLSDFLASPPTEVFVFRSMGSIIVLDYKEIVFIEARGNYVNVHGLVDGHLEMWLRRSTMDSTQAELANRGFLRVHRSFLVNREHLRSIRSRGRTFEAELSGGARVPVSRETKAKLEASLADPRQASEDG